MGDIFSDGGFEVVGEAGTGEEAIVQYDKLKPDLVTLDIVMPGMGGIEALKRIREKHPESKILIVSAIGQQQLVVEAINLGAAEFIVKPFQDEKVVSAANRVLK